MSATTKLVVSGGLTSSSDARAHLWWGCVAWSNVSRSRLINRGGFRCHPRCAGQQQKRKDSVNCMLFN
jgi:hypothetical protein